MPSHALTTISRSPEGHSEGAPRPCGSHMQGAPHTCTFQMHPEITLLPLGLQASFYVPVAQMGKQTLQDWDLGLTDCCYNPKL